MEYLRVKSNLPEYDETFIYSDKYTLAMGEKYRLEHVAKIRIIFDISIIVSILSLKRDKRGAFCHRCPIGTHQALTRWPLGTGLLSCPATLPPKKKRKNRQKWGILAFAMNSL